MKAKYPSPSSIAIVSLIPVGHKYKDGKVFEPYPNSKVINCPKCNKECWIGPRQNAALKSSQVNSAGCIVCLDSDGLLTPKTTIVKLRPKG